MTIAIYAALVIATFLKKKSKLITWLIFLFMWIMGAFCVGIADEPIYMSRYNNPGLWLSVTEYGFQIIISFCHALGLNYTGFRGVVIGIEIILVGITVLRYAKYPNIVLLFFIICPFPLNVAQLRSSLATSVMIFSLRFLIDENERKTMMLKLNVNEVLFILCILMATLIHTSSVVWLTLLIAKKWNTRKVWIFTLIFNFAIYFVITPVFLQKIATMFGAGVRMSAYLSAEYAASEWRHRGPAIYVLFVWAITLATIYFVNHTRSLKTALLPTDTKLLALCVNINVVMLILVGVILRYTSEFTRIQEGITVFNFIVLTNCLNGLKFTNKKISISNLKLIEFILLYLVVYVLLIIIHYLNDSVWIPFWFGNTVLHL